jgi:25S rRNA (uracil2634-N3)-methyltransferase
MSKAKTKQARREAKRDGARKIAAHQKKTAKAATTPSSHAPKPLNKKQKQKQKQTMASQSAAPLQASQLHAAPFGEYEHILLVGEGDFSFTRSLAVSHGCSNVTATSYDSADTVLEKYPHYADIRDELTSLTPPVPIHHDVDATRVSGYKHLKCKRDEEDEVEEGMEGEGWDTIVFMFPHTGGLSTDVNRQVRANQALLVGFFKACLETGTAAKRMHILANQGHGKDGKHAAPLRRRSEFLRMGGRVIVTLFEGEPYTLWNVRDLARHVGLKCVESWKFDAKQYPGYAHVRTLGTIEGGGAWRGEDRDARCYVFEKVPLVADSDEEKELEKERGGGKKEEGKGKGSKKKRARESDSEDD